MFKDKVIWITGASSGIGEALACKIAEAGGMVVLSARNREQLEVIKSKLKNPEQHLVVSLDLEQSETFDGLVDQVLNRFGRIDFLVNNGGISQRSEVSTTSIDIDRKIMEVNYFGNIALTKAVLPVFKKQQSGHFVVMSSIAGKFGFFLRSAYSASKHALHGFYESLMLEEEQNGVKVTIVCPGKINTNISMNAISASGEKHGSMDHNQATGMTAEHCANALIDALKKGKKEVLIGNKEVHAVTLKRFFPRLFWRIIRKQSAT
jgi:short-subunit dehydrogenase